MFVMPVGLAIVIATVQNSTFELLNENKIPTLLYSRDSGMAAQQLDTALEKWACSLLKNGRDTQ